MEQVRSPLSAFYGLLAGHLLIVLTGVFWSIYWTMLFRAEEAGAPVPSGLLPTASALCGLGALLAMAVGIEALPHGAARMPFQFWSIPVGGAVFFVLWLATTTLLFKRVVTSELFLIPLWAVLQACALYVLAGSGWLSGRQTAVAAALTLAAFGVGLVCYVLHYRLDDHGRFINGLVPYVGFGAVALTVDALLVFNKIHAEG